MVDRSYAEITLIDTTGAPRGNKTLTFYEENASTPLAQSLYTVRTGGSPVVSPATNSVGIARYFVDTRQFAYFSASDDPATKIPVNFEPAPEEVQLGSGIGSSLSLSGTLDVAGTTTLATTNISGRVTDTLGISSTINADTAPQTVGTKAQWYAGYFRNLGTVGGGVWPVAPYSGGFRVDTPSGVGAIRVERSASGNDYIAFDQSAEVSFPDNWFYVSSSKGDNNTGVVKAFVNAENVMSSAGHGWDMSACSNIADQRDSLGGGNNLIRATESRVRRLAPATAAGTWAHEVNVTTDVVGLGPTYNLGFYVQAGGNLAGEVVCDTALLVNSTTTSGWNHLVYYIAPDGTTVLYKVDSAGKQTGGTIVPRTDATYTLGDGAAANYLAVYSRNFVLMQNGSVGAPVMTWNVESTSGLWRPGAGELALSLAGAESARWRATGLTLEKSVQPKELSGAPTVPPSGYLQVWADNTGGLHTQTSAGVNRQLAPVSEADLRQEFLGDLLTLTGDTRVLWTPKSSDTTTSVDESLTGRTLTHSSSIAAALTKIGLGYEVAFAGTRYSTSPDTANLTFGTGAADTAFTILALVKPVAAGAGSNRQILSKYQAGQTEWYCSINNSDQVTLLVADDSAGVVAYRSSNAAITHDVWQLYGLTYDGGGGATAANGMTVYVNGLSVASTATNAGAYVAMEDKSAVLQLGAVLTNIQNFNGSIALVVLCQKNMTASEHWAVKRLVNAYFNQAL